MHRAHGTITRGTTNPGRLHPLDRWWQRQAASVLRGATDPLVVDLGFGASAVTTAQWYRRLVRIRPDVRVFGVEIDRQRVAEAQALRIPGRLEFGYGGFELAGCRPVLVRAANVLRQYDESEVREAWRVMRGALAPKGLIVEGTCDELGRVGAWVVLDSLGPIKLGLISKLSYLDSPTVLAERLPKILIHHNFDGEPIAEFVTALDDAWRRAAPWRVFGPRDRWRRCLVTLLDWGWPVLEPPPRRRDGTVTVPWSTVDPTGISR